MAIPLSYHTYMASKPDYNKTISRVAKSFFAGYGIRRRGQSRIWLDDNYWYTTVIKFQPVQGKQGTCLNVGANFHWYRQDYFSFDIGSRESEFIGFSDEQQFEEQLTSLVEVALSRTLDIRTKLATLGGAAETIISHHFASDNLWGNYHRAVFIGLTGQVDQAQAYFDAIAADTGEFEWIQELKKTAVHQRNLLTDIGSFKQEIAGIIEQTRQEKRLGEIEVKYVW